MPDSNFTIAAVGDLHCTKASTAAVQALFGQLDPAVDVLVLCGDLTDYGLPEEAHVLARELASLRMPIVATLGNHDFESGRQTEVAAILQEAGVHVLDGEAHEIGDVGFAGTKGFHGGFGRHTLWSTSRNGACATRAWTPTAR
jgi:Icc-related predicted phosphoesterase